MQIQPNVAVVQAQHNPKVAIVYFEMCPKCVSLYQLLLRDAFHR